MNVRLAMLYGSILLLIHLGWWNMASLTPADTTNQLAFSSDEFSSHRIAMTYPNMIPAPTAIAKNCVAMP